MRYARIEDGRVAEIITLDSDTPLDTLYPSSLQIVEATNVIIVAGWSFSGGVYAAPAGPSSSDLIAYALMRRWQKEIGGLDIGGMSIATDDRSKQMILGARMAASFDSTFTTQWVAQDGAVYPLTAAQIIGVSNAVLEHVNNCFMIFSTVQTGVKGATITSFAQIDAAFTA